MKKPTNELSNLVVMKNDKAVTTSLIVAKHFQKRPKDVNRAIENLPEDEFSRRNFAPRDYVDERGQTQPMYEISRDGFAILGMGFTGKIAYQFKIDFIKAFNLMEKEIQHLHTMRQTVDWQEARDNGKCLRRTFTDVVKVLEQLADKVGGLKGGKPENRHYYSTLTKMVYKALFGDPGLKSIRDQLDVLKLQFLSICESACADEIDQLAALELDYHIIYAEAKKRVIATVEGLSASKLTRDVTSPAGNSAVKLVWDQAAAKVPAGCEPIETS